MFYVTTIQSVRGNLAVDTQGKALSLIGYLPVQAGDSVFTDGTVIFGHAPPKGETILLDEELSGIPLLGDSCLLNDGELRGYFTRQGKYKQFKVFQDDWIVNSEKDFAHGNDFQSDEKIIDAEITANGDEFIVTGGIYHDRRSPLLSCYVLKPFNDDRLFVWEIPRLISFFGTFFVSQYLGSDYFPDSKKPASIFRNGQNENSLDLQPYARDVEERALLAAQKIMEQQYTEEDIENNDIRTILISKKNPNYDWDFDYYETYSYRHVEKIYEIRSESDHPWAPAGTLDEPLSQLPRRPEQPFIAYTTAYVLTCSVGDNGFDGIVFAASYGYCFPYIKPGMAELFYTIGITHLYEWKCVPFGASCLYRINSSEISPIAFRDFGGIDSDIVVIKEDTAFLQTITVGHATNTPVSTVLDTRHLSLLSGLPALELDENFLLPVGNGFYHMDTFGRLTFFNSDRQKIADNIPVHDDFFHVEVEHGEFDETDIYNARFNNKPWLVCNVYSSDGKVQKTHMDIGAGAPDGIIAESDKQPVDVAPLDGYYIKQSNGSLVPLQFTPLFFQFKNGSYLYGVKGGKLFFKKKNGEELLIGDGLRNFRLRELKDMSKAKK